MQNYYTPKGKQLTLAERQMIERWLKEGKSNREMARRLAKAPQTINNEVKHGQVRQLIRKGKYELVYSANFAQNIYDNNRKRSVKKVSLTKELKEKIMHYMNQKFSPEMMVKTKGVDAPISTIYTGSITDILTLLKKHCFILDEKGLKRKKLALTLSLSASLLKNDQKVLTSERI